MAKTLQARMVRVAALAYLIGILRSQEDFDAVDDLSAFILEDVQNDIELAKAIYPHLKAICSELEMEFKEGGPDGDIDRGMH